MPRSASKQCSSRNARIARGLALPAVAVGRARRRARRAATRGRARPSTSPSTACAAAAASRSSQMPGVRLAPRRGDEVGDLGHLRGRVAVEPADLGRVEARGVEQAAVDVELQLARRRRCRCARAASPRSRRGRACARARAGCRRRGRACGARVPPPRGVHLPPEERARLVAVAELDQRLERVARVAQPGVAVVPVLVAAELLGQRRRRRGDDRARRREDEQLERERAADDRLAPRPVVAGARPPTPARSAASARAGPRRAPAARARPAACARPRPRAARASPGSVVNSPETAPSSTRGSPASQRPARARGAAPCANRRPARRSICAAVAP